MIKYFGGGLVLKFPVESKSRVLSVLSTLDVSFWSPQMKENDFYLSVPYYRKKKIISSLTTAGIEYEVCRVTGLISVVHRYKKRVGIPIGALLVVIMVWMSGRVIWNVNVEGNSRVTDREIIELLEKLGCGVGDVYDKIDFDVLHNRFLMECHDIAWISVNMNGTHANVEVIETDRGDVPYDDNGFYNVVASESGCIEKIAAIEGKPVVEIGDTVLEGELLISGAISYREDTLSRYESAKGSVYAKVYRSLEVSVPLETKEKVYTGKEIVQKKLRFFNFNINLFRNSRIQDMVCDKITVYDQVHLFDMIPLPIFIEREIYREYTYSQTRISSENAEERALSLYREKLFEALDGATLLSKTVTVSENDDGVTVRCDYYCLADIAKKVPLVITEN